MRWKQPILLVTMALLAAGARLRAQEVIDRMVARVENDIILQSEVSALGHYQQFVDGKTDSNDQILDRLIDQWIVRNEAETARFPHPSDAEVAHGVERVTGSFASPEEFETRKKQSGLSDKDIRNMVASQLYLSNYLDSRFRSAVQIDAKEVEDFYQSAVVPRAKARNQAPPALDASREYIQEALVQRGINEQADRWLKESRARVRVEKFLTEGAK
jgi:parvulin-like peptidyl-prolyl isomerase